MSDAGEDDVQIEAEAPAEVAETAAAPKGKMSVTDAIKDVLKKSLMHDGLARGLRECAKALDKRQAHLCVLNESCTEAEYIKLIEALCQEHKINLVRSALCISYHFAHSSTPLFPISPCPPHHFYLPTPLTAFIITQQIQDPKQLGEWAGLCKIDRDGHPRKVVGCSCVVVKDYGQESEALSVLLDYFNNR